MTNLAWCYDAVPQVTRNRNVIKPAKGKRQCNCKMKMVTKQIGPGMFQQFQTQECEQCDNVKYARESVTLEVRVEPGMQDKEVQPSSTCRNIFALIMTASAVHQDYLALYCTKDSTI